MKEQNFDTNPQKNEVKKSNIIVKKTLGFNLAFNFLVFTVNYSNIGV